MDTFPCGHPRSAENTRRDANGKARCRCCHNAYLRRWMADRRQRERGGAPSPVHVYGPIADRILAVLRTYPDGLRLAELRAKMGYRQRLIQTSSLIGYHRRRHDYPVTFVREGKRTRYRAVA